MKTDKKDLPLDQFIEFLRVPDQQIGYLFLNLTMGQIISLVFVSIGITLFYLKNENR